MAEQNKPEIKKQVVLAKAKARLKILTHKKAADIQAIDKSDRTLLSTLHQLTKAVDLISQNIKQLNDAIKKEKQEKKDNYKIRIAYYEHQKKVIQHLYTSFTDTAKKRLEYYDYLTKKKLWEAEKELCRKDTLHWFKYWAWTSDPRLSDFGKAIPFIPFPYQEDCIKWLEELIFIKKSSGLIEKSRDMGITWIIMSLFFKHWMFHDNFQALVGSMTIDDVDTVGNPSSLLEKVRIQALMQPKMLLPIGWDREVPYMKAINPENQNSIIGESLNWRFGRSGRYTAVLLDELAAVDRDSEVLAAVSQSTPCKIYVSTPRGMHNEFAQLRFSEKIPIKTYHWSQHPLKSKAWYEYQKLELGSETRIAQELDIDYQASTPNRVYPEYSEIYHVITYSELMEALPEFSDNGQLRIPNGHSIVMGEDVSMGDQSAHVLLWFLTFREGTITKNGIDVSGSVLIYREIVMPPKSTPSVTAETIKAVESEIERQNIAMRYISQEATTEQEIYASEHKLYFKRWKTNYTEGITRVREYLQLIDRNKPHPFRRHPKQGEIIKGRPRLFILSVDEQGELKYDKITGKLYVVQAKDNLGCKRLREEFPLYHFPATELGKEIRNMRPKKVFDDAMDILRCVADEFFAPIRQLDQYQERRKALIERYSFEKIKSVDEERRTALWLQMIEQLEQLESEKPLFSFRAQCYHKALKHSS